MDKVYYIATTIPMFISLAILLILFGSIITYAYHIYVLKKCYKELKINKLKNKLKTYETNKEKANR